jgi:hypothetical protein
MQDRFINPEILEEGGTSRLLRVTDVNSGQSEVIRVFSSATYEEWQALLALLSAVEQLNHPHIEKVAEVIQGDNEITIVTEMPAGEPLSQVVRNGPLSVDEFKLVCHQLLDALASAHKRGVVHGSLNADRIFINRSGETWNTQVTGYGQGFGQASQDGEMEAYLCVPPEQWEQQAARRRSDVYSLGCILYLALAARSPFDGKTLKVIRHKHINHDVRPLKQLAPQAPDWICSWVMSLIEAAPEKRPSSAEDALDEFRRAELACAYPAPGGAVAMISNLAATAAFTPVSRPSTYHVPSPKTIGVTVATPVSAVPGPRRPQANPPRPSGTPTLAAPVAQNFFQRNGVLIGAAAVGLILCAGFFMTRGKKSPPVVVVTLPNAPIKVVDTPSSGGLSPVSQSYPSGRSKPVNYSQLVIHHVGDAGVLGGASPSSPANLNGSVLGWRDLAERGKDSTLRQGNIDTSPAKWVQLKPDITFPLSREHRFVQFSGEGTPCAALNSGGESQASSFPFGSTNTGAQKGMTFAMVVFQEVKGRVMTVFNLNSNQGSAAVRFGEKGDLRLNLRVNGVPEADQPKGLQISIDKFTPSDPLLVTGFWRGSPSEAQVRVRDGSGRFAQSPIAPTPVLKAALTNLIIGRDSTPSPTSANQNKDAKTLKAFTGGIAELLIYATPLPEADLAKLESDLAARYFPPSS